MGLRLALSWEMWYIQTAYVMFYFNPLKIKFALGAYISLVNGEKTLSSFGVRT
jgi:hypothetical protein